MKFDKIIITAANEAQAAGYREISRGLSKVVGSEIIVAPDPGGNRVGSLLATLNALGRADASKELVLVCHSGGDSKRLPAYSAFGKAFATVNGSGRRVTLFERIVTNMERLKLPRAGALVVCGDVSPTFDFSKCVFKDGCVTGVAYYDTQDVASRHGVYVARSRKVTGFLQKPSPAAMKRAGALKDALAAVDTGIMFLDPGAVSLMDRVYSPSLKRFAGESLDLYEDFTGLLLAEKYPFEVNIVDECDFYHIGSTRELIARMGEKVVDYCQVPESDMELEGTNVVTFIPRQYGKIKLSVGECLTGLPLKNGKWKYIKYKVTDDFKTDGTWEKLRLGELMKNVDRGKMLSLMDEAVVELPLRIDLCGGWSDTPPICNELGGAVLNAAVKLNGRCPVKAHVIKIARKVVRVRSVDLKKKAVLLSDAEIYGLIGPHDWCALVKAALKVTKFTFEDGYGLDISISADVPKGSGMGTSSLLGAALVSALMKVKRVDSSRDDIAALTLELEREMGTGGGWQDQLGGLHDGVKLLTSKKGVCQKIEVERLDDAAEKAFKDFLSERALLYFTGQKRMARNVLRGVLKFYSENPCGIAREIINRLKNDSFLAFDALKRRDYETFSRALNSYWSSKKALDPGSTNAFVESIIARINPWVSAVTLCGAGGGGFMLIVSTDAAAKRRLKKVLSSYPVVKEGRFYDFSLKL